MKRVLLILGLVIISVIGFAQSSPVKIVKVANATTTFGHNLPIGTKVHNLTTGETWVAIEAVDDGTLTTRASSFEPDTKVSATLPLLSDELPDPTISIQRATSTQDGYLSSTKYDSITANSDTIRIILGDSIPALRGDINSLDAVSHVAATLNSDDEDALSLSGQDLTFVSSNLAKLNAANIFTNTNLISANTYSPLILERTGTTENVNLALKHGGGTRYLGIGSDEVLRFGSDIQSLNNDKIWHEGNSNLPTVGWEANFIYANGLRTFSTTTDFSLITRTGGLSSLFVQQGDVSGDIASFRYGSTTVNGGTEALGVSSSGVDISGILSITNTTDATSTTTGSGVFGGGIGVAKKAYFGSTLVLRGYGNQNMIMYPSSAPIGTNSAFEITDNVGSGVFRINWNGAVLADGNASFADGTSGQHGITYNQLHNASLTPDFAGIEINGVALPDISNVVLSDGTNASWFVYGTNANATTPEDTDLNNILKSGHYASSIGTLNTPTNHGYLTIHTNWDNNNDLAFELSARADIANQEYYLRTKSGGTYGGWNKIYHSGSPTITAPNFNATTEYYLNGTSINTAGTLSNVAYLNQVNNFTNSNTITSPSQYTMGLSLETTSSQTVITNHPVLILKNNNNTNNNAEAIRFLDSSGAVVKQMGVVNEDHAGNGYFYIGKTGNEFKIDSNGDVNLSTGDLTTTGTIQATTGIFTNLTNNYVPVSTANGLDDSPIAVSGTNVGIGTTSPDELLTLNISGLANSKPAINFYSTIQSGANTIGYNSGKIYSQFDTDVFTGARLTFATPTGVGVYEDVMTLKNGNVGIGTSSPSKKLHIYDGSSGATPNSDSKLVIESSSGNVINMITASNSYSALYFGDINSASSSGIFRVNSDYVGSIPAGTLGFQAGGGVRMSIATSGNIGIGITSPSQKLHVVGNGLFTGSATATSFINSTYNDATKTMQTDGSVIDLFDGTETLSLVGLNIAENIEISDTLKTTAFQMSTGASDGYYLKSDSDGNGTWAPFTSSQTYKGTVDGTDGTVNGTATVLIDGTGTAGDYYRCDVAGTYDYGSGSITLEIGDDLFYNGTRWQAIAAGTSPATIAYFEDYSLPSGTGAVDYEWTLDHIPTSAYSVRITINGDDLSADLFTVNASTVTIHIPTYKYDLLTAYYTY